MFTPTFPSICFLYHPYDHLHPYLLLPLYPTASISPSLLFHQKHFSRCNLTNYSYDSTLPNQILCLKPIFLQTHQVHSNTFKITQSLRPLNSSLQKVNRIWYRPALLSQFSHYRLSYQHLFWTLQLLTGLL